MLNPKTQNSSERGPKLNFLSTDVPYEAAEKKLSGYHHKLLGFEFSSLELWPLRIAILRLM